MEAQSKQARERGMSSLTYALTVTEELAQEVRDMFTYHKWDSQQEDRGKKVRDQLIHAVLTIIDNVPPCPTRSVAIRKIIEARMDCNNAITSGGRY